MFHDNMHCVHPDIVEEIIDQRKSTERLRKWQPELEKVMNSTMALFPIHGKGS